MDEKEALRIANNGSDLTHEEKVRGAALAQACHYYTETIVKDGNLYRELVRDNKVLKPATYQGVLDVAFAFEAFVSGRLKKIASEIVEDVDGKAFRDVIDAAGQLAAKLKLPKGHSSHDDLERLKKAFAILDELAKIHHEKTDGEADKNSQGNQP